MAILGIAHVLWVPMLPWLMVRLEQAEGMFATWMMVLVMTNALSLVIDIWDVSRYFKGEQTPHYVW